ncbi:U3 small nucleolar RNA-interacting protein 2-like [Saccoglossus kowalevskii]|uniref:U3 small nucleolar RNA-interacting protein 2-like n=1 Tax=Saccoglossus kowalevskii TaxID=10224 RepID=A0ABM0MU04_SACKO|nr:PREDICTED: U3 small nucleolar RNA-interacting protein 2-like [Saccoglossus kowalevskii]
MSGFFIKSPSLGRKPKTQVGIKKKKAVKGAAGDVPALKRKRKQFKNEEIESDSEAEGDKETAKAESGSESDTEDETPQEKRLRLTKQYLAELEAQEREKKESDELLNDAISHRLHEEVLEQAGKLQKQVASDYQEPSLDDMHVLRGHQLSTTCLVISPDNKHVFSASKDCSIIKWNIDSRKKEHVIPGGRKGTENKHKGHTAHVLCLAISSDGKFLASGCRNKVIHIWDPSTCELLHTFKGHRDAISGLSFRRNSHQLFSSSHDRSVKIWDLDEMAYVETLFGHQDSITGIDSLTRERAITCGGRDGTIRIWKVVEESQLVFHGHQGSIDCVQLVNEGHFISGADDGSIALWSVMKKKPSCILHNAHSNSTNERIVDENWITSVGALQSTDLVASAGSKDGNIRLWQCGKDFKTLTPLFKIPIIGFVNALKFSNDGSMLVAGVGQEHKLGRWWRIKEAKNSIVIIKLKKKEQET